MIIVITQTMLEHQSVIAQKRVHAATPKTDKITRSLTFDEASVRKMVYKCDLILHWNFADRASSFRHLWKWYSVLCSGYLSIRICSVGFNVII